MRKNSFCYYVFLVLIFGFLLMLSASAAGSFLNFVGPQGEVEESYDEQSVGGWAVVLLDEILNVPNHSARYHLLRAGFAAGPLIFPHLEKALKDDRTAEFSAKLLAFMGSSRALRTLQSLVDDPRDLSLKRFFYGSIGEFNSPRTRRILLDVIRQADQELDPTVTEMAILALTVLADPSLIPFLKEAQDHTADPVIRDDIGNAIEVIQFRVSHLEKVRRESSNGLTLKQAVEAYFVADLLEDNSLEQEREVAEADSSPFKIEIEDLTFTPNASRALARVRLHNPVAAAVYELVLQKRGSSWSVASAWAVSLQESERIFQPPLGSLSK